MELAGRLETLQAAQGEAGDIADLGGVDLAEVEEILQRKLNLW